ncbi:ATP-binding protein [Candidatus Bipolaricaulota bacterium]|nr:ATP-binding protein [Candidatus Bipolaricaulota bacterium]
MSTSLNISKDLDLDLEAVIGQCIAILGIRGSGKSNTAGVIIEELLDNSYPMTIVDIEGEYFGLKEKYEVLVVGTGEGVDIEIDASCAGEIAQVSIEQNVPVVLDLSGFLSDERSELLKVYLSSLWNIAGTLRRPYIIGIEEAHEFIPQGTKSELKELIARIALRGRKRGLGAIIVSQRSAKVDKDVLSQAGMLLLHRVVHEVDMRVYGELLPWRKSEVKEIISSLETGDCIYLNGETILPIYVRERRTFHAGFTPSLEAVKAPELRSVSASIIEAIERARGGKRGRSEEERLQERLAQLERVLDTKDKRIAELEEVARTLGYIRLEIPPQLAIDTEVRVDRSGADRPAANQPPTGEFELDEDVPRRSGEDGHFPVLRVIDVEHEVPTQPAREDALPPAVVRHVDRLLARVAKKTVLHRRLLAFLVGHGPGSYSVEQIAAWTSCAREVIEDDPPREFLDAGLIGRERRSSGLHYQSTLRAFVNQEFAVYQPDIGGRGLHLVTQLLRDRLASVA